MCYGQTAVRVRVNHCRPCFRWRREVNSTDRAHPKSAPPSLTLPSSHALTQSANQEWSSLLRPHPCKGLLNLKVDRARWVKFRFRNTMEDTTACAFQPLDSLLLYYSLSLLPYLYLLLCLFPSLLFSLPVFFSPHCLGIQTKPGIFLLYGLLLLLSCVILLSLGCSSLLVCCCRSCPLQFQMAHLVPLKPYAAPVPRSQSLCDQPTKTMSAFPTQDPSLTPTPRPIHSRELVRQNSDPTSETPAPQAHQIREDRGPWIRLPDVELPPKVRSKRWCWVCLTGRWNKSSVCTYLWLNTGALLKKIAFYLDYSW